MKEKRGDLFFFILLLFTYFPNNFHRILSDLDFKTITHIVELSNSYHSPNFDGLRW